MGELGKTFADGEIIVCEGEVGDCMYVVQEGKAEVFKCRGESMVHLGTLSETDFFGEMAIFEREVRSATVRAQGQVRVLTIDKKSFLRRISQDPSMAFHLLEKMANRIRQLDTTVARMSEGDRRNWETRPLVWERGE